MMLDKIDELVPDFKNPKIFFCDKDGQLIVYVMVGFEMIPVILPWEQFEQGLSGHDIILLRIALPKFEALVTQITHSIEELEKEETENET